MGCIVVDVGNTSTSVAWASGATVRRARRLAGVPSRAAARAAVEVARGCARGCRFCQAGYVYRPVRQRGDDAAVALAVEGMNSTGKEDFSFLSLSISDWPPLEGALTGVHAGCGAMEVNASLPSLRAEALTDGMIERLGRARHGSFTLAPEAGGTLLVWEEVLEMPWFFGGRVGRAVVAPILGWVWRRNLKRLAARFER